MQGRILVIRMNLDGQPFVGEKELHQERERLGDREPHFPDLFLLRPEQRSQIGPAPHALHEPGLDPTRGRHHWFTMN